MFKKLFILTVLFSLLIGTCSAQKVYFQKIANGQDQWNARYAIIANLNGSKKQLDKLDLSVSTVKMINNNTMMRKIERLDINHDQTKDWIITILTGRGGPDLFYIIDGNNLEVIFHHLKCREELSYNKLCNKLSTEGRGSRHFKHTNGLITEIITIPFIQRLTDKIINKLMNNPRSSYYRRSKGFIKDNCCLTGEIEYTYRWDKQQSRFILKNTKKQIYYFDRREKIYL